MNKHSIELSDSERLVLFEFLSRIIDDEYGNIADKLFEDISEEYVLCTIKCQLEKAMLEPKKGNYNELVLQARETVRKNY